MTLSKRQRKPAFSCPDPQPIRYRENRRWSVPGPVVRNSGPRGIFPLNPNQNGPPHNPAGPVFIPSSPPGRHPAPRTPLPQCRLTARRANRPPDGFRGRPAAAPTAAPGAAGPAGLPSALSCRPPAPPRQRARRTTRQARFYPILIARTAPPPAAPPQTAPARGWRYPAARRR